MYKFYVFGVGLSFFTATRHILWFIISYRRPLVNKVQKFFKKNRRKKTEDVLPSMLFRHNICHVEEPSPTAAKSKENFTFGGEDLLFFYIQICNFFAYDHKTSKTLSFFHRND